MVKKMDKNISADRLGVSLQLFPQHWLTNTLFDDGYIATKAVELNKQPNQICKTG